MKGSIVKRGNSWTIIYDIGRDANGKRLQKWQAIKGTKKDAERELNKVLHDINSGSYIEPSKMAFSTYLDRWIKDYAKSNVTPKTLERYEGIIKKHLKPKLGHHPLSKLKPLHIQSFYTDCLESGNLKNQMGLSKRTVLHFHRLINAALKQAIRWELLVRNPADGVTPPKPDRKEMNALSQSETATLLKSLEGHHLHMPTLIAVTTGMRRGEISALKWQDVDLENKTIYVRSSLEQTKGKLRFKEPKTKKSKRNIPLAALTVDALKTHKKEQAKQRLALGPVFSNNDLVCPKEGGSPLPPDTLSTRFSAFMRTCNNIKRIRFHDLRHTHATTLLMRGVNVKVVSERLGHSSVSITLDTYGHVMPGIQEDAIADFDSALKAEMNKK